MFQTIAFQDNNLTQAFEILIVRSNFSLILSFRNLFYEIIFSFSSVDVSIPMDEIESKISSMLIDDIKSGKYDIGEMVVPQEFEITSVKNGKLRKEKIVVKGESENFPVSEQKCLIPKNHFCEQGIGETMKICQGLRSLQPWKM